MLEQHFIYNGKKITCFLYYPLVIYTLNIEIYYSLQEAAQMNNK